MTITSGHQWRKRREEGVEFQFPTTGNVCRIRPLDMDFFIKEGKVHNLLESTAFEGLTEKNVTDYTEDEITAFKSTLEFLDKVVTHCFVSPRIVENPTADDEISLADLTLDEKYLVFALLATPGASLDSFRPQQKSDVGLVLTPKDDEPARESDHGDRGVGVEADRDEGYMDSDDARPDGDEVRAVG
jgi:hypothetical protein